MSTVTVQVPQTTGSNSTLFENGCIPMPMERSARSVATGHTVDCQGCQSTHSLCRAHIDTRDRRATAAGAFLVLVLDNDKQLLTATDKDGDDTDDDGGRNTPNNCDTMDIVESKLNN